MRIDIDSYREIIDTLTRNKSRSFLTGFGVFWGVFMLVALIGGGQGLKEMLNKNFAGFATNSALIWAQPTSKAYKGFRKGRQWTMVYKDVERLKEQVPELDVVTPMVSRWGGNAVVGEHKSSCNMSGVTPDYAKVMEPEMYYGRYLNDMDLQQRRKVCVLGKKVYKTLFPGGGDPCGKLIRVDSVYYRVVGVDFKTGGVNLNGDSEEAVVLPITLMQQTYNMGEEIHILCVTAKPGITMSKITDKMRSVVARAHLVDPTDEQGVMVFNTEVLFQLLVTVRERTTEIGIRRAIGATPTMILSQIISESIVLTLVAGMSGILFGVLILQMLELANTEDGILTAHFQVQFWTAITAALAVSIMGVLAGLAPAARAMSIKPVDAMRDE